MHPFAAPDPMGYRSLQEALTVEWSSPSNIALVKYWGKHGNQLPMNPSVSFTLTHCITRTSIELTPRDPGQPWVLFYLEGQDEPVFNRRVETYLETLLPYFPFLEHYRLKIHSFNTFPHSAGIASSASAMSALSLCLCSIDENLRKGQPPADPMRKASFLARLGSGSASRSLYPYLAIWGQHSEVEGSSDDYAIPVTEIDPVFRSFKDAILIVDAGKKAISSSTGHKLMENHPFADARKRQAMNNISQLTGTMRQGDLMAFTELVEEEALTLHGLMMSSRPSYTLLKSGTLDIIQIIREFRNDTQIPLCFTLDAGPNIHLLYPQENAQKVEALVEQSLRKYCSEGQVIYDEAGPGPKRWL